MSRRRTSACALCLTAAIAALSMASCAATLPRNVPPVENPTMNQGVRPMLDEIYASRKPVRFEQIDVSGIVLNHFPLGTDRATVKASFESSNTTRVVEDAPGKLVLRDDKGQAMLDPDARSVVMTFSFDLAGKLTRVDALHLKHQ